MHYCTLVIIKLYCYREAKDKHTFDIIVTDDGGLNDTAEVIVILKDVNDVVPHITNNE